MTDVFAYLLGVATLPALLVLAVLLDLVVNLRSSSRSECQWCDWALEERPGRPLWWVKLRFRIHRDRNHRAKYLAWKANR